MHHAPAGPSLFARLLAEPARWRPRLGAWGAGLARGAALVRLSRIVPVTLTCLLLGGLALIVPAMSEAEGRPGSVALSSTAGRPAVGGLVPATGEGWTQDGAPVASRSSRGPAAATSGTAASTAVTTPAPAGATADGSTGDAERGAGTTAGSTTGTTTGSARPPASGSTGTEPTGAEPTGTEPTGTEPTGTEPTGTATPGPRTSGSEPTGTSASPSTPPEPSSPAPADPASTVLALVNAARAAEGCPALVADASLAAGAAAHSTAMRDLGPVAPASPDDAPVPDPTGRSAAVVAGVSDPSAVLSGWLAWDSAAVLGCGLTSAGVGAVDGHWTLLTA